MDNYTEINARTIDRWVEEGWEWDIPISKEIFDKTGNIEWTGDSNKTYDTTKEVSTCAISERALFIFSKV